MKRIILSIVMALAMFVATMPTALAANATAFTDVDPEHWAANAVYSGMMRGAVNGMTETTFNPNGKVTHAQFAKMFAGWCEATPKESEPFADVNKGEWYYDAANALQNNVPHFGSKENPQAVYFYPQAEATREYIIATLMSTTKFKPDIIGPTFSDEDTIDPAYRDAMSRAIGAGIITGYTDRTLRPKATVTRAEAVVMIDRMLNKVNAGGFPGNYQGDLIQGNNIQTSPLQIYVSLTDRHNPITINVSERATDYRFNTSGIMFRNKVSFTALDSNYNFIAGILTFAPGSTELSDATLTVKTLFRLTNKTFDCTDEKFNVFDSDTMAGQPLG